MKRVIVWLAGLVGIAALGRRLARRTHRPAEATETAAVTAAPRQEASVTAAGDDPAGELRRKLAAARRGEPEPGPDAAPAEETLEERRARVHAKAREALEAMADHGTAE